MFGLNFISCASWVRRGIAKEIPFQNKMSKEEIKKILKASVAEIQQPLPSSSQNEGETLENASNNEEISFGDNCIDEGESDVENEDNDIEYGTDSEDEDDRIQSDDNLIIVGHIQGETSILEVYVYNEKGSDLYVHHDVILPTVPLCAEPLSCDPSRGMRTANLVALGGMKPVIGIWDLDVMNTLEPVTKLGRYAKKKRTSQNYGHTDAVLDIKWNPEFEHVMASCSVDRSVILWDLDTGQASKKMNCFDDKVQSMEWHAKEAWTLVTGSSDRYVRLFDCRAEDVCQSWQVDSEVEKVTWVPSKPFHLLAGTSSGRILLFDARVKDKAMFELSAHVKEITGLCTTHACAGLVVSCSMDGLLKAWHMADGAETEPPTLVSEVCPKLGELQSLALNPDVPSVYCLGGNNASKNFSVANLRSTA